MTDRELMQQAVRDTPASKDEIQRAWIVSDLLRRRLAQPEQEPVAWMVLGDGEFGEYTPGMHFDTVGYKEYWERRGYKLQPLYTTPPQRKPLTDEEIGKIAGETFDPWSCARAIEAAHGIKGEA